MGSGAAGDRALRPTEALQQPPKPVTVLIAGGGTGGHVIPALSIGEALKRRNQESKVVILGSDKGIEADLVPKAGFDLVEMSVSGLPDRFGWGTMVAGWRLFRAVLEARKIITRVNPDVVVGTGGYVSVAAILAAKSKRRRTLIQEQNSIPGRANKQLAKLADEVHIHFTEARRHFKDRGKLRLSGNPVRVRLVEGRGLRTLQKYRLQSDRRTVLILGGSQGAHRINTAFTEMLTHFRGDRGVQFVIQTGKQDYRDVLNAVRHSGVRVVVKSFIHNMEELYGIADLAVARAGAMTLSELAACGVPSILIPYPHATHDHQTENARSLAEKEAAILVPESELTGDRLAEEVRKLLHDRARLRAMGGNAFALSRPDAARHIAEAIESLAGAAPDPVLYVPDDIDSNDEDEEEDAKTQRAEGAG